MVIPQGYGWQVAPCAGPGVMSEVSLVVDMVALQASVALHYKITGVPH